MIPSIIDISRVSLSCVASLGDQEGQSRDEGMHDEARTSKHRIGGLGVCPVGMFLSTECADESFDWRMETVRKANAKQSPDIQITIDCPSTIGNQ
jgi:hypothetical protein